MKRRWLSPWLVLALVPAASVWAGPAVYPDGVTVHRPDRVQPGRILLYEGPNADPKIRLVNRQGGVVHQWTQPSEFDFTPVFRPLDGGSILAVVRVGSSPRLVELDWSGKVVFALDLAPLGYTIVHDADRLENGNTVVLARRSGVWPAVSALPIWEERIYEVDPAGTVVWAWSTVAHIEQLPLSELTRQQMAQNGGEVFGANALNVVPPNRFEASDPRFARGNLILSQRSTSLVLIVEKPSGDVVWSWDGAVGQHSAVMIEQPSPGHGNLLLFDNGGVTPFPLRARAFSQAVELDPSTLQPVWTYGAADSGLTPARLFSPYASGVQRLGNGNTLVTESEWSRTFEVEPSGAIVWEHLADVTGARKSWWVSASWGP